MYPKYKTYIFKSQFYILISLLALLALALVIWVLIPFGYGIKQSELTKNLTQEQISTLAISLATKTLIAYLANNFVLIFFLIYLVLLRHKLKAGYVFFICWILVFITLIFLPFYQGTSFYTTFQLGLGILVSLISGSVVISLIIFLAQYHIQRKFNYYQWYKIHKGKSK
ncbi:hypothetical protein [Mesomycoplasma hyorhinis]|uniref:Uncharacterized protein n=3 Tax=Mesomycoplasma hyorhinis TaxID=2100 RepID=A0AAJ2YRA9_MESHY|nr:hypothetical protein [Mesomycoplasma hyorhinis]ADM21666.1 Putative uncharacterized protein [Mesomycoplasma hyorhinis HUB-1]AEC45763.1 hypothetical protein SRH_00980 [Mesomycoplasma hyorhinis MCLD]AEX13991.1 hypothetical protein MYM_0203 [Mesomycoplasma hyorhinis GDL-1]AFX74151.1 hypothetical protein MOS_222 [Mesomycoplasma hyorhinis SK76]AHA40969.1 hypothetical protein Q453_0222 [Mesomycoplasma hyorhinis DBS 1050]